MIIKSLHIYPIKGLGGIDLQEANLEERGFEYDRRWMLVDENGEFISQRTVPEMALFRCNMEDGLNVVYKENAISINVETYSDRKILTTVWEHEVYAYEVSDEISMWFSEMLNIQCRLVRMTDQHDRYKKLIKGPKHTKLSFADGYPYMIIGTASLAKISNEVGQEIPANRFRPSIVVKTLVAHEEDDWAYIEMGDVKLQVIKRCARCVVVNIDQNSAAQSKEPLKSLSKYRMEENNVNFGINVVCLVQGSIRVGDIVVVKKTKRYHS